MLRIDGDGSAVGLRLDFHVVGVCCISVSGRLDTNAEWRIESKEIHGMDIPEDSLYGHWC